MKGMSADVNFRGLDQWSALHFSASAGHEEIVKELVKQQGIEIEAVSTILRTPLHIAA